MSKSFPRILIAAPKSGEGKTTVVCGLLQALINRGKNVSSFKCGPDFIDPLFHKEIIGANTGNLDLFFTTENTVRSLFVQNANNTEISIIEGVMGFYDGVGGTSESASSYHLAKTLLAPTVLVVNARGASLSVIATIKGFCEFREDSNIKAVILNQCTSSQFAMLKPEIEVQLGITAVGYLEYNCEYALESRHLGLVTVGEIRDIKQKLNMLAESIEKTVDINALLRLCEMAPTLDAKPLCIEKLVESRPLIAVAQDRAFCFYYDENLSLLKQLGAELVAFSPLNDNVLPNGADALYIGGGYPELYARELESNTSLRIEIKKMVAAGLPIIAECGGFMYLQNAITNTTGERHEMVGAINSECRLTKKLCMNFGYVELVANEENKLCPCGASIKAHEFHYSESTNDGSSFCAKKPSGTQSWNCVHNNKNIFAGYPHLYFYSNQNFAKAFVLSAANYKEKKCSVN